MKQRRVRKWTDDDLRRVVRESTNLTDVLRGLGLGIAGGNHKSIKYWIDELKLDTSHFNREKQLAKLGNPRKLTSEEVFSIGSGISKNTVRRWAKSEISYVCHDCGNCGEHNGKPLTLQLDHINGDPTDNRKQNLRWLCPNCHSQTETFAGRKAFGEGVSYKTRCECGASKGPHAKRCRSCWDGRK